MSNGSRSLLEQVARGSNLKRAWELLNKRPGSRGVDEVTIEKFVSNLRGNLRSIEDRLRQGTYRFSATRAVAIPKKSGSGKRPLRIPTVADRLVQKAILLRLEKLPKFRKFQENPRSFAYQRGRSLMDLVARVKTQMRDHAYVLESDITRFFDEARQDLLIRDLERLLPDPSITELVRDALRAEVADRELLPPDLQRLFPKPGQGLPQGAALAPLLSNVYLHPFDRRLTQKKLEHIRYADDFIVFAKTWKQAEGAFYLCRETLQELGLSIPGLGEPPKPSRIIPTSGGFDFVGLRFERDKVMPSAKAIKRLYARIAKIMDPRSSLTLLERFLECEHALVGWRAAYGSVAGVSQELRAAVNQAADSCYRLLKSRGLARGRYPTRKQRRFLMIAPRSPRKTEPPSALPTRTAAAAAPLIRKQPTGPASIAPAAPATAATASAPSSALEWPARIE
jgi:RNA-directed DNA polymerase